MGEPGRFNFHERNKFAGFAERQFFRGVVRLPEAVSKRFDEFDAFPRKNGRRALLYRDRDHRGPTRMRPKADRGLLHASLRARSEEHTSELQSLTNLVCRLLLEKKKNKKTHIQHLYNTKNQLQNSTQQ